MLQDLIERFRYRFQLWRREQREDWIGPPGTRLPNYREYMQEASAAARVERPEDSWRSIAPKNRVVLMGSTPRFIVRTLTIYLAVLVIVLVGCFLLGTFVPLLHYVCLIAAIVLGTTWTLMNLLGTAHILKQRKQYREWRQHLTNQSS
jgi:hypothetical protein